MTPLPDIKVMLASTADRTQGIDVWLDNAMGEGGWIFEPKLDGIRATWHGDADGNHLLRSRRGTSLNDRFRTATLPAVEGECVLDGELVAFDDSGSPSFNSIQRAFSRPGDPPVGFVAFDCLWHPAYGDARGERWADRRALLELLAGLPTTRVVPIVWSDDGPATWDSCEKFGFEGVMAKRENSTYHGGRSPKWVKLKGTHTISAVVTGRTRGEGSRVGTFGALELALLAGVHLESIGEVGSGFNEHDLAHIVNLELPFVIDVAYQEWTGSALRFPVFKGLRTDIPFADCTMEQLSREEKVN